MLYRDDIQKSECESSQGEVLDAADNADRSSIVHNSIMALKSRQQQEKD